MSHVKLLTSKSLQMEDQKAGFQQTKVKLDPRKRGKDDAKRKKRKKSPNIPILSNLITTKMSS